MPHANRFRHQDYQTHRPWSMARQLTAERLADENETAERMAHLGRGLARSGVAVIYLVHGTFVGNDAIGILRDLARLWPAAAQLLARYQKAAVDRYLQEQGNYTSEFAQRMQRQLNVGLNEEQIPVRLFQWSSENHHLGRMEGALELIEELEQARLPTGKRVLIWAHSHGGNLLALLTNLLAADAETRGRVFRAARCYYRWPVLNWVDRQVWPRVHELLEKPDCAVRNLALDLVTFGTPIRYGWDIAGYARLLHFIHHRPAPRCPPHEVPFPPAVEDVLVARYGDYVQQLGIAGTNLSPGLFHPGMLLANWRLGQIVQAGMPSRNVLAYLRCGTRVSDEGLSLLVNYGLAKESLGQHLAGHSVYTRSDWMLFHMEQIVNHFYPPNTP